MAIPGFLCTGEVQVIVIKQVTFDIIKALLSRKCVIFVLFT